MKYRTRIEGDKAVNKRLKSHAEKVTQKTKIAFRAGSFKIINEAAENVPVVTGNLKRSIHAEVEEEKNEIVAYIGTDVDYAAAVEYGTPPYKINSPVFIRNVGWRYIKTHPGLPARPYLRPAFDQKKDEAVKEVTEVLDILLKKI